MASRTAIEWAANPDGTPGETWNPVRGCTRVSQGCVNCYAEVMAARFSDPGQWGAGFAHRVTDAKGKTDHRWTGKVSLVPEQLPIPFGWKKPRVCFVNSTSDLWHESLCWDEIAKVYAVMALSPRHTFIVLTKRSSNMREGLQSQRFWGWVRDAIADLAREHGLDTAAICNAWRLADARVLPNVWHGVSAEDQPTADTRILDLIRTPSAKRLVSLEPLLGPIDLTWLGAINDEGPGFDALAGVSRRRPEAANHRPLRQARLDWVIAGLESGDGARVGHPDWIRAIRDACVAARVAFFFKQWGAWVPCAANDGDWPVDTPTACRLRPDGTRGPDGWPMQRLAKRFAGRTLDGRTWDERPEIAA